ncbi:hypothetical protein IE81DRAFT_147514 [Ceraceosorus guamensis]|uniref:Uncharacterized protein n=1 Tax=Ceraceosorus guamensis TaxID=1522189 RepID=A0A316W060_9BASI|nr:hypothetical protein IE81DRAFT_147514 [Ceraceosorus guamensis]PWN42093.1 hypothetical protein IE81DRAFT_147514 [Ceraceosorus guamensis]
MTERGAGLRSVTQRAARRRQTLSIDRSIVSMHARISVVVARWSLYIQTHARHAAHTARDAVRPGAPAVIRRRRRARWMRVGLAGDGGVPQHSYIAACRRRDWKASSLLMMERCSLEYAHAYDHLHFFLHRMPTPIEWMDGWMDGWMADISWLRIYQDEECAL